MHVRLLPPFIGCAVVLLAVAGVEPTAASQCPGVTSVTSDLQVTITPDPGCLEVTVEPIGCGDQSAIFVRSTCSTSPTVTEGFHCNEADPDAVACHEVYTFAGSANYEDGDVEASFDLFFEDATPEIPDAKVFIEVGYHETFEGTGADLDEGGCSASPGATTTGGAFAVFALLFSLASRRRRRYGGR